MSKRYSIHTYDPHRTGQAEANDRVVDAVNENGGKVRLYNPEPGDAHYGVPVPVTYIVEEITDGNQVLYIIHAVVYGQATEGRIRFLYKAMLSGEIHALKPAGEKMLTVASNLRGVTPLGRLYPEPLRNLLNAIPKLLFIPLALYGLKKTLDARSTIGRVAYGAATAIAIDQSLGAVDTITGAVSFNDLDVDEDGEKIGRAIVHIPQLLTL